jgi:hypothetical protein
MRIFTTVAERKDANKWDLLAGPDSDFVAQDKALDALVAAGGVIKSGKTSVSYSRAIISDANSGIRRRRSF